MRYGEIINGALGNFPEADDPHFAAMMGWKVLTGEEQKGWLWNGVGFEAPPPEPYDRVAVGKLIDDSVADIYNRFNRFSMEYVERESQAQAYKDAGYTGTAGPRVTEFSVPAGLPTNIAVDLILSQSANLRTAMDQLSALRMRKYEVTRAATDVLAQAIAEEILADIKEIGDNVS